MTRTQIDSDNLPIIWISRTKRRLTLTHTIYYTAHYNTCFSFTHAPFQCMDASVADPSCAHTHAPSLASLTHQHTLTHTHNVMNTIVASETLKTLLFCPGVSWNWRRLNRNKYTKSKNEREKMIKTSIRI